MQQTSKDVVAKALVWRKRCGPAGYTQAERDLCVAVDAYLKAIGDFTGRDVTHIFGDEQK